MTNEDIRRVANDINAAHMNWKTVRHVGFETERLLLELVSQAYQEAARMACNGCLNDWTLEPAGTDGELRHKAYDCHFPCTAEGIHALKARLVLEPVS